MKHSFYFRFYKVFQNETICCVLADIAYCFYCFVFIVKKILRKKKIVSMTEEEANRIIEEVYPRPTSKPKYCNPSINNTIDLSVVIPVYNHADIIRNSIESIINQKTRYNYEVIIVDDGSTDGAQIILKDYEAFSNVKLITQNNGGIGAARDTGINHASGKYLMFIDCDDLVHNDIIENLMDKAYKGDYDMVMAAHNLVKERNGKIYSVIPNVYPKKNLMGYKNDDEIMNLPGLPWAKVYKRELWNEVRFFPGYWYEDSIIHCLVFPQCKKFAYIQKVMYEYKWYESNFSHTQGNSQNVKVIDRYWLLIEMFEHYCELGLSIDDKFYTVFLRHLSVHFYNSVKQLDDKIVTALFVKNRELYIRIKPNHIVRLPYMLKQIEKAFEKNDFELWKIASSNY